MTHYSVFDNRHMFNEEVPTAKWEPLSYEEQPYILHNNIDIDDLVPRVEVEDPEAAEKSKVGKIISARINP